MHIKHVRIILANFLFCIAILSCGFLAYGFAGEDIVYTIKPLGGRAEYSDLGVADLEGKKVHFTIFKTDVFGFKDTEKIYSDPETDLPVRVERDVKWLFGKEDIVEEYNQKDFKFKIIKFKAKKKISEKTITADQPINNAILVPFSIRKVSNLKVGWTSSFALPQKYKVTLKSLDEIRLSGKKYSAYHFTSNPDKFEIWISSDQARIPLMIKGKSGFSYTLFMKEHKR